MSTRKLVLVGVAVALVLAGFVSYYASNRPDGLMHVAGEQGFADTATTHRNAGGPLAGYATEGVSNDRLSGGVAGVTGVVVVLALVGGLTFVLRRRRGDDA